MKSRYTVIGDGPLIPNNLNIGETIQLIGRAFYFEQSKLKPKPEAINLCGMKLGVDLCAERYAQIYNIPYKHYYPKFEIDNKPVYQRNREMFQQTDCLIYFSFDRKFSNQDIQKDLLKMFLIGRKPVLYWDSYTHSFQYKTDLIF